MSRINTYEDLVLERKNAEARIVLQKQIIRENMEEVQERLKPFLYLLPMLNIFKREEKGSSLLKGAASLGIDLLVGQTLLAKSNWLARLVVPMLLKVFSSKAISVIRKPGS